jgi:DNA-directed RNA polymerase subunit RPC12/RpoP
MGVRRPTDTYAYRLIRVYGLTPAQYEEILTGQGGGCAICGKTKEEEGRNLAVDHDHVTGEIRGVLCNYCNHRVVGRHRDPELLRKVANYLEKGTGLFVPERKKRKRRKRS